MLLLHLLVALGAGVLAAVAGVWTGFSAVAVLGSYLLGGMTALATTAQIERQIGKVRGRRAERLAEG